MLAPKGRDSDRLTYREVKLKCHDYVGTTTVDPSTKPIPTELEINMTFA